MIGVLVSGAGTNLQALIDAGLPIAAVASNKPGVPALARAEQAEIATAVFDAGDYDTREERDVALAEWLQAHNRGRPDSDGRSDRDEDEIEEWARAHDLPYFDQSVHFPDFRIEYELDGRDQHEDVEIVTEHYRGEHAASVARAGFRCYGRRGGSSRGGGRRVDPRLAEDFV